MSGDRSCDAFAGLLVGSFLGNDIPYPDAVKNIDNGKKTEAGVALVFQDGKKEKCEVFFFQN